MNLKRLCILIYFLPLWFLFEALPNNRCPLPIWIDLNPDPQLWNIPRLPRLTKKPLDPHFVKVEFKTVCDSNALTSIEKLAFESVCDSKALNLWNPLSPYSSNTYVQLVRSFSNTNSGAFLVEFCFSLTRSMLPSLNFHFCAKTSHRMIWWVIWYYANDVIGQTLFCSWSENSTSLTLIAWSVVNPSGGTWTFFSQNLLPKAFLQSFLKLNSYCWHNWLLLNNSYVSFSSIPPHSAVICKISCNEWYALLL